MISFLHNMIVSSNQSDRSKGAHTSVITWKALATPQSILGQVITRSWRFPPFVHVSNSLSMVFSIASRLEKSSGAAESAVSFSKLFLSSSMMLSLIISRSAILWDDASFEVMRVNVWPRTRVMDTIGKMRARVKTCNKSSVLDLNRKLVSESSFQQTISKKPVRALKV